ncbi:MAG TPA: hypothetical protein VK870_04640 [Ignavibacteriaceae bacterium]|nr:hypothetical protein [Ignavibacteriaceae bacterium]
MKKLLITSVILLGIGAYLFWPEKVITYPEGTTAPEQPLQTNLSDTKEWEKNEFRFKALAEFKIKARVLSRNSFSVGKESKISPVDFALGWGPMSDQAVIDRIKVTQRNRWYRWETDSYPIPRNEIMTNSANVHIIPADDLIDKKLSKVYKGSLIEMKGYLVEVTTEDRWFWRSSLRRDDTGGGSCELFWVEELNILDD